MKVAAIKIDPYLNWDSGTLNPYQHGEVFVTYDGMETDLDLGHYERFLDVELPGISNITTGKVYQSVISKERKGDFLGACVQIIPHITNEIKEMVREISAKDDYDVVLVELGGTVGDIESQPFLEALRQLRNEEGSENEEDSSTDSSVAEEKGCGGCGGTIHGVTALALLAAGAALVLKKKKE